MPIPTAPNTLTNPDAGVMDTSPATAPLIMPRSVGRELTSHSMTAHVNPAVAAAVWVTTNALVARPFAESALPALNPNHPNHSMPAPSTANGRLCGGVAFPG